MNLLNNKDYERNYQKEINNNQSLSNSNNIYQTNKSSEVEIEEVNFDDLFNNETKGFDVSLNDLKSVEKINNQIIENTNDIELI